MSFAMGLVGCGVMGRRHVIGMKQLQGGWQAELRFGGRMRHYARKPSKDG